MVTNQRPASDDKFKAIVTIGILCRKWMAKISQRCWPRCQAILGGTRQNKNSITVSPTRLHHQPKKLQQEMLGKLHEDHHGVSKTNLCACQAVGAWNCRHCTFYPLMPILHISIQSRQQNLTPLAQRAWQHFACDLVERILSICKGLLLRPHHHQSTLHVSSGTCANG